MLFIVRSCLAQSISVYRIQDEGEFLYYTYSVGWADVTELQFLLKEGDYCLKAQIPSADSAEWTTFELPFTVEDPDMDETQSFDRTEIMILLDCNDTIQENEFDTLNEEIKNRVIQKGAVYVKARRKIAIGNLENEDTAVNAEDSALLLQCCAEIGAGGVTSFTSLQVLEADVNKNGICDAEDAAIILQYSAEIAAGNYTGSFESYVSK